MNQSSILLPNQVNGHDALVKKAISDDMADRQRLAEAIQFHRQTSAAVFAQLIAKHVDIYGPPDIQKIRDLANCARIMGAYLPEAFGLMQVKTEGA